MHRRYAAGRRLWIGSRYRVEDFFNPIGCVFGRRGETGLEGCVGDFAAEMGRRLDQACEALRVARESSDDYGIVTHLAELEELLRVAGRHGLKADPSIVSTVRDAARRRGEGEG
jgi:hypothetical protein